MSFGRQVLHVFTGDVRRFWPALAGLGAVILFHRFSGLPVRPSWSLPIHDEVFIFVMAYTVLTVLLVQHHSVIDDRGFWNVRPITPEAILISKTLFVGLFLVGVPVLVQVEWLVRLAGGGDSWPALWSSLLHQASFLALVMLGAALTRSIGGFLTLTLATWVCVSLVVAVVTDDWRSPFDAGEGERVLRSRWLWLTVGASLLGLQYRLRRPVLVGAVGAAVLLLGTAWIQHSRTDLTVAELEPAERRPYATAAAVHLELTELGVGHDVRDHEARVHVWGTIVAGTADGVVVGRSTSTLAGPAGTFATTHPSARPSPLSESYTPSEFRVMQLMRQMPTIAGYQPASASALPLRSVTQVPVAGYDLSEDERYRSSRTLHVETELDVFGADFDRALPLEPDTVAVWGGVLIIDHVDRRSGSILVEGSFRRAGRYDGRRPYTADLWQMNGEAALVNHERREFLRVSGGSQHGMEYRTPRQYFVPGSLLLEQPISWLFDEANSRRPDDEPLPDEWFDDAELRLLAPRYEGTISATFETELSGWPEAGGRGMPIGVRPR